MWMVTFFFGCFGFYVGGRRGFVSIDLESVAFGRSPLRWYMLEPRFDLLLGALESLCC